MTHPLLRRATAADLPLLETMVQAYYRHDSIARTVSGPDDRAGLEARLRPLIESPTLGRPWLILSDEPSATEPVGYAIATFGYDVELGGRLAVLTDFFLDASHRARGLGTRALAAIEQECAELGLRAIELQTLAGNPRSTGFYAKRGYAALDRIPFQKLLAPTRTASGPVIHTARLTLRLADRRDVPAVLRYLHDNDERLAPLEPPRPEGYFTPEYWTTRLDQARVEMAAEQSLKLWAFAPDGFQGDVVVGSVGFSQMFRGPFLACYLGYAIDGAHEGEGYALEAVRGGIEHVFGVMGYHRIMANHLPENARSAALLQKLGFAIEGTAKNYLCIAGRWRDHVLNSLTNPDCPPPVGHKPA